MEWTGKNDVDLERDHKDSRLPELTTALTPSEVGTLMHLVRLILDDDRPGILRDVVSRLLTQWMGDESEFHSTYPISTVLDTLNRLSQSRYSTPFVNIDGAPALSLIDDLNAPIDRTPLPDNAEWESTHTRSLMAFLLDTAIEAYYAHPQVAPYRVHLS